MRVYLGCPLITVALFRFHCFMVMACLKLDGLGGWRGVCFCFVFVSWFSFGRHQLLLLDEWSCQGS